MVERRPAATRLRPSKTFSPLHETTAKCLGFRTSGASSPFFFPDHLDVKALQQLQHFLSGVVRPIRDRRPGISFPKKLPGEPAAWTNRRDDPVPEPWKIPRLAKRQRKAGVHQIAWGDFHLRKVFTSTVVNRSFHASGTRGHRYENVVAAVVWPPPSNARLSSSRVLPPFARATDREAPRRSSPRP